MLNANMSAPSVPVQAQIPAAVQPQEPIQRPKTPPVQISIEELPATMEAEAEVEEEECLDESEEEEFEEDKPEHQKDLVDAPLTSLSLFVSAYPEKQVTSRKRSCSDLEADTESDTLSLSTTTDPDPDDRSRTPPKRLRREGSYDRAESKSPSVATAPPPSSSPSRQRKRTSEELEESDELQPVSGKRLRPDVTERPLPSRLLSSESTSSTTREKVTLSSSASSN